MSKTASWDRCPGAAGLPWNSVCHDPSARVLTSPSLLLHHSQTPSSQSHGVPHNLHGARPELGLPGSNTHAAETKVSILGSPVHLEEPQAREISVGEVSPAWQRGGVGSTQLLLLLF